MGSDEYAPVVRGGLKLKGVGAKPQGVEKHKHKKHKKPRPESSGEASSGKVLGIEKSLDEEEEGVVEKGIIKKKREDGGQKDEQDERLQEREREGEEEGEEDEVQGSYKTEAQRKHEEMRRKRLQDRLAAQGGPKTHKQRVEELNTYLSRLSEHHDMPRIGPG